MRIIPKPRLIIAAALAVPILLKYGKPLAKKLGEELTKFGDSLKKSAEECTKPENVDKASEAVKDAVQETADSVTEAVDTGAEAVKEAVQDTAEAVTEKVDEVAEEVKSDDDSIPMHEEPKDPENKVADKAVKVVSKPAAQRRPSAPRKPATKRAATPSETSAPVTQTRKRIPKDAKFG